ncbi:MAG: dicarboxylate/amino acid:cation symporter [Dysgonamonadaceae bacterium]|jgi:Na+/H+-dicarboxylate symporter|nr:dicarboxylate/amino acid:cation symporter [Dysgonamonadaceae bacterium]
MKLHWQIFTALVLGAGCGILFPGAVPAVSWIGVLFMNALSMIIVPVIFFSIVTAIAGFREKGESLKKLGIRTVIYYVVTMLIAILTGLSLVNLIKPGRNVQVGNIAVLPDNLTAATSLQDIIVGFIPKNIFYAFTQNNTLPVILIAFLIGLNLSKISAEGRQSLTSLFKGGLELTLRIMKIIIRLSPIGIFAIVAAPFGATNDFRTLIQTILLYFLTVAGGLTIHTFVWLPLLLRFGYRVKPGQHLKNMLTPLLTAFSTASSGATLPLTMYAVEHKDGVSAKITNFTIPLGAAINMDGTALLECVAVIFIAQAYGVELSVVQQILIAFTSLLCAIGAAGIPMAALVMMTLILNVLELPLEGIGLVIGVDRILDMMRTAVNVYGDTCVAVMVAKSEGEKLGIDR